MQSSEPQSAGLGAKEGNHQGRERNAGDGHGNQQHVPGAGQAAACRAGQPAKLPDQGAEHQDGDPRVRVALEYDATQRSERDCGPGPGQLSALPCQPGIGVLDVVWRRHRCVLTADSSASAAAARPMIAKVTARILAIAAAVVTGALLSLSAI